MDGGTPFVVALATTLRRWALLDSKAVKRHLRQLWLLLFGAEPHFGRPYDGGIPFVAALAAALRCWASLRTSRRRRNTIFGSLGCYSLVLDLTLNAWTTTECRLRQLGLSLHDAGSKTRSYQRETSCSSPGCCTWYLSHVWNTGMCTRTLACWLVFWRLVLSG